MGYRVLMAYKNKTLVKISGNREQKGVGSFPPTQGC